MRPRSRTCCERQVTSEKSTANSNIASTTLGSKGAHQALSCYCKAANKFKTGNNKVMQAEGSEGLQP
eukprot:997920-Amphidinium_carterae.1